MWWPAKTCPVLCPNRMVERRCHTCPSSCCTRNASAGARQRCADCSAAQGCSEGTTSQHTCECLLRQGHPVWLEEQPSGSWGAPSTHAHHPLAASCPSTPLRLQGSTRPAQCSLGLLLAPPTPHSRLDSWLCPENSSSVARGPEHCQAGTPPATQHPPALTTAQPGTAKQGAGDRVQTGAQRPRGHLAHRGPVLHLPASQDGPHTAQHGRGRHLPLRQTHRSGILTRR